jgi:trehalose 6-phosphate phosphatase
VSERPLFFLDYDGTLAPIVDEPMEAFPHPDVPALLTSLKERYPVFLVSGRHLRDVSLLMNEPVLPAIGLHGTQRGRNDGTFEDLMPDALRKALGELRQTVPSGEGVRVEEKGPAFAVHYRQASNPEQVKEQLAEWLQDMPDTLTAIWGKKVVELRPRHLSKGTAVTEIASTMPERTPIYIGDDVTDEDAFRALGSEAITIRVGEGETVAAYRLSDPDAVVAYLRRYVD